ncbi:MAG: hypothetical protein PHS27_02600 [Candidatus Pacebacteria bacterium]|nr:hypothetical protein [Candidatus Paceibacterota bacterium]
MKKQGKVYKMLPRLEALIKKVENDIKKNRNLSSVFSTQKDINEYLDYQKKNNPDTKGK